MAYAIETKKRKFDRILESLSDAAAASPSRTSLNSRNNPSTTSLTRDDASDGSKRRRITDSPNSSHVANASTTSLVGHYLPSNRTAFLERLATFRQVTQWHVPSTDPINAAAWAKRGWICIEPDTVSCGVCRERVHIDLSLDKQLLQPGGDEERSQTEGGSEEQEDHFEVANQIYDAIVKRYQDQITSAHSESCLWRKRGSDASVQRIEGLLNTNAALAAMKKRYVNIMSRPDEIPEVTPLSSDLVADEEELSSFEIDGTNKLDINAMRLAICGWDRKSEDVIECRNCFRSLGLWLYRGSNPAIERLDSVDDHLEYCPWRTPEAQDTEVSVIGRKREGDTEPIKTRVSGWSLVYLAMVRENSKKRTHEPVMTSETDTSAGSAESSTTSEQRERRMRDLLKRIKEIKKPFNVKSLLRRKEKGPV